jgi:hypothetical protein
LSDIGRGPRSRRLGSPWGPTLMAVAVTGPFALACAAAAAWNGRTDRSICAAGSCAADSRTWAARNPGVTGLLLGAVLVCVVLAVQAVLAQRVEARERHGRRTHAAQVCALLVRDAAGAEAVRVCNAGPAAAREIVLLVRDRGTGRSDVHRGTRDLGPGDELLIPALPRRAETQLVVGFTDAAGVRWHLDVSGGEAYEVFGPSSRAA